MVIGEALPCFITDFFEKIDTRIRAHHPGEGLSKKQKYWLSFCVLGTLITSTICWARFEKVSLGRYKMTALSWMFRQSKIPWALLFYHSVSILIALYCVTGGTLNIDETDNLRSKRTKKISWVHKLKDKATGGYAMGQCMVFLVLVTPIITIPVGFKFYMPDPDVTRWRNKYNRLKKNGVPANQRPKRPPKNPEYPSKNELAIQLLREFQENYPDIKVQCINADALYGNKTFLTGASAVYESTQIISQIDKKRNVRYRGKDISVEEYFSRTPGVLQEIKIRGEKEITATIASARLYVSSQGVKRFVVAVKYEGEENYRYLVATNMSWRTEDIVKAYTLRWLVEVFFQDWKANEGWATLTKLTGEEGSRNSLILSLLVDHCLLFHPEQLARIENKLPAYTVGSLRLQISTDSLFMFIQELMALEDPAKELKQLASRVKESIISLAPSKKHMVGRDLGNFEPSPSLKYRATG
jgi:hypothetical protein